MTKTVNVSKGELLQRPDGKKHNIIRVRSGLLRMYTTDEKGKEHIYLFAPEGWTLSDFVALAENTPSQFYVDAIENSTVEIFSKPVTAGLPEVSEKDVSEAILMMGRRIATLQKRVVLLLNAPALERYEHFLSIYPDIVNRVPQKMIASYLGITPQALSKIRGQKRRQRPFINVGEQ